MAAKSGKSLLLGSGVTAPQERTKKVFRSLKFPLALSAVGYVLKLRC